MSKPVIRETNTHKKYWKLFFKREDGYRYSFSVEFKTNDEFNKWFFNYLKITNNPNIIKIVLIEKFTHRVTTTIKKESIYVP